MDVVVLERGELNREASGTNAGSFHFQIAIHQLTGSDSDADAARLLADVRLHAAAAAVWSELERRARAPTSGVHVTGGLMVAETEDELGCSWRKQRIEQDGRPGDRGADRRARCATSLPTWPTTWPGASYCAREGHANPLLAAPAFAARAIEAGARIRTHAPVHGRRGRRRPGRQPLPAAHRGRRRSTPAGRQRRRRLGGRGGRAERADAAAVEPKGCTST